MMRTSEFLEDLKRHISVPTYQPRFDDEDILALASSAQQDTCERELTNLREEFLIVEDFVTIPATGRTPIPERAIGRTIREIWISSVNSTLDDDYQRLVKFEIEELLDVKSGGELPRGYYFRGDALYLYPPPAAPVYGRLQYAQRGSRLVLESRTATVISYTDDTITVDAVPDNIAAGDAIDVTEVNPGFGVVIKSALVESVTATTITLADYDATTPLAGFAAGDIVSLKRETSVIQLPEDAHNVLIWATCVDIESGLGIDKFIMIAKENLKNAIGALRDLCAPRAESSRPKIYNPRGLLRSCGGVRRFPRVTV